MLWLRCPPVLQQANSHSGTQGIPNDCTSLHTTFINRGDLMKRKALTLVVFLILCATERSVGGQVHSEISMPPNGRNQRAEVSQWIGLVKITIDYHSPNVHGGGGGKD